MFNTLDIAGEEESSYIPSILIGMNTRKKLGTVVHIHNPNTQKTNRKNKSLRLAWAVERVGGQLAILLSFLV